MPIGWRGTCTGRRRIMGCNRGTRNNSGGWRRRNCRSPYKVRLICSMLPIIPEFHINLVVNDPLNVWSIYHILSSMVLHIHYLCLEEGTKARRRLAIKYG
jgi:hypothetical protein